MNARIFLFVIMFCVALLWADDYVFDNYITVDPSLPPSMENATNITDAISRAYSLNYVGNTLISVVNGNFQPIVAYPSMSNNKVVKVVGTRINDTQMTTVSSSNSQYLAWIGEPNDRTGNILIFENIRFEGASTGVEIHDIKELEIYFTSCIFSNQVLWAIDSTVPFSITNSKIMMPNTPGGYCQGAIRITGQDDNTTDLVATISGNVFTGKFYDHIIHAGIGLNIPCWHYLRAVNIEDNVFDATLRDNNTFETGNGAVQTGGVQTVNINRNIFHLNSTSSSSILPYQIRVYNPSRIDPPISNRALRIMNNTLWSDTNQSGFVGINVHKGFHTARIMNNIVCNLAGVGIDFYTYGDPIPGYTYNVQNNCLYNCIPAIANAGNTPEWTIDGQLYCDPLLDVDYKPIWNSAAMSPCVDAGNRDTDGDGVYWNGGGGFSLGMPDDADPDRSPLDIGAGIALSHQFEDYPMPVAGAIKWLSFPVVNDLTEEYDRNYYFFRNIFDPSVLQWIMYKVGNYNPEYCLHNQYGWQNELDLVSSLVGYKVQLQPGATSQIKLSNPGFIESPNSTIQLHKYLNGTTTLNENWIGYFHNSSSSPFVAFSQVLDKILSIRTQYWSMARDPKTGVWLIPPGNRTLNYGDMVIVTVNQDCSFTWNNAVPVDPKVREQTDAFVFEEKPDYTPLYIDMANLEDIPSEIGVYVDDVCKGAVKVDNEYTDICVYLDENEILNPDNCELVLYYADKSGDHFRKTCKPSSDELQAYTDDGLRCYSMKISGKSDIVAMSPAATLIRNFPNPFNPSTYIAYELSTPGIASIGIYNVKGQKIRSLVKEHQDRGYHQILWDGKDEHGDSVASGVYYYRLNVGNVSTCNKMLLMK